MKKMFLTLILAVCAALLLPAGADAHCDTMDGPVVADAREALAEGDPSLALKWVSEEAESEIRAAFDKAQQARKVGGSAAEVADLWFFETLVRVHRAGEGAPYTGLKSSDAGVPEAVRQADAALQTGEIKPLAHHVGEATSRAIAERFAAAREALIHRGESVARGREFVSAYVEYVHLVEKIAEMVENDDAHGCENCSEHPEKSSPGTNQKRQH